MRNSFKSDKEKPSNLSVKVARIGFYTAILVLLEKVIELLRDLLGIF
jgi:hypothetical protein